MKGQLSCPFCLSNNLFKGKILAESSGGFATNAQGNEHCYLIIPKGHAEALTDLSDNWWVDFKELLGKLPVVEPYNLSLNLGTLAGQTLKHLHFWIVPREAGKASTGSGLASLIGMVDGSPKVVE